MARISVQFHATRHEIALIVLGVARDLGLWIAYETFAPTYGAIQVDIETLEEKAEIPHAVNRIVLSTSPLDMDAALPLGLIRNNPASLAILLGPQTADRLGESALQALTDDMKSLDAWRKVRKALISATHKGARVVNVATGAADRVNDHYYSAGAKDLWTKGVKVSGPTDMLSYDLDREPLRAGVDLVATPRMSRPQQTLQRLLLHLPARSTALRRRGRQPSPA